MIYQNESISIKMHLYCIQSEIIFKLFFAGEALTGMLRCQMDDNKRVIKKDQSASGIC